MASTMIVSMLGNRAADATLCPSEVARALVIENKCDEWRTAMPVVHATVDALLHRGAVKLIWKGEPLEARSGPYRIVFGNETYKEI